MRATRVPRARFNGSLEAACGGLVCWCAGNAAAIMPSAVAHAGRAALRPFARGTRSAPLQTSHANGGGGGGVGGVGVKRGARDARSARGSIARRFRGSSIDGATAPQTRSSFFFCCCFFSPPPLSTPSARASCTFRVVCALLAMLPQREVCIPGGQARARNQRSFRETQRRFLSVR